MSSTPLPIIFGNNSARYPFTQTFRCYTTVSTSEAGNTYRSIKAPPTVDFEFPSNNRMLATGRVTTLSFFNSAKGEGGTTPNNFSVTTDQTYGNLSFTQDILDIVERAPKLYDAAWSLSQLAASNLQNVSTLGLAIVSPSTPAATINASSAFPPLPFDVLIDSERITVLSLISLSIYNISRGVGGTTAAAHAFGAPIRLAQGNPFPKIMGGCFGGYPYHFQQIFQSVSSKMPVGPKYSYSEFGSGGFFPASLTGVEFDNPLISDDAASVLIAHWLSNWGNFGGFPLVGELGSTFQHTYYAEPTLKVVRNGVDNVNIVIKLKVQTS